MQHWDKNFTDENQNEELQLFVLAAHGSPVTWCCMMDGSITNTNTSVVHSDSALCPARPCGSLQHHCSLGWYHLIYCWFNKNSACMITWRMYQRCLFTVTLVPLRNVLAESQFTDFTSTNSFTWNLWRENRGWSSSSREQHIHTVLHLEDFLLSETSFVLSFFISCKAALSQVLYFNKVPSVFFFLLLWEPGRRLADRPDTTPVPL